MLTSFFVRTASETQDGSLDVFSGTVLLSIPPFEPIGTCSAPITDVVGSAGVITGAVVGTGLGELVGAGVNVSAPGVEQSTGTKSCAALYPKHAVFPFVFGIALTELQVSSPMAVAPGAADKLPHDIETVCEVCFGGACF
jgi:hypothetical protein